MGELRNILEVRGLDLSLLKSEKPYSLNWPELIKAVEISKEILLEVTRAGVLYDVDVDGAVAGKLIEEKLKGLGLIVYRKMNTQKKHGLNQSVVDWVIEKEIEVLYVVDAGTNDLEYHQMISDLGVTLIVLDHHDISREKEIDNVYVVNCSSNEDLPKLSGAGVCYRYIELLDREVNGMGVTNYEPWVGLTVLSDHCSMLDAENRYYVERLYEEYQQIDLFKAFPFWGSKRNLFLFGVIPFINACIRVNEVDLVMNLVLSNNLSIIKRLIDTNRTRILDLQKQYIEVMLSDCQYMEYEGIVLIRLKDEHIQYSGLTGLIANKIMGEKKKSTLVLYSEGEYLRGSFRGLASVNNVVLEDCGWVVRGHAQAAGVELVKSEGAEILLKTKEIKVENVKPHYDIEIEDKDVVRNMELLKEMARFNEMASGDIETIKVRLKVSGVPFKEKYGKRYDYNFQSFKVREFSSNSKGNNDEWIIEPLLDREGIVLLRK